MEKYSEDTGFNYTYRRWDVFTDSMCNRAVVHSYPSAVEYSNDFIHANSDFPTSDRGGHYDDAFCHPSSHERAIA